MTTTAPNRVTDLRRQIDEARARQLDAHERVKQARADGERERNRLSYAEAHPEVADPMVFATGPGLIRAADARFDAAERDYQRAFNDGRRLRSEIDRASAEARESDGSHTAEHARLASQIAEQERILAERTADIEALNAQLQRQEEALASLEQVPAPPDQDRVARENHALALRRAHQAVHRSEASIREHQATRDALERTLDELRRLLATFEDRGEP